MNVCSRLPKGFWAMCSLKLMRIRGHFPLSVILIFLKQHDVSEAVFASVRAWVYKWKNSKLERPRGGMLINITNWLNVDKAISYVKS